MARPRAAVAPGIAKEARDNLMTRGTPQLFNGSNFFRPAHPLPFSLFLSLATPSLALSIFLPFPRFLGASRNFVRNYFYERVCETALEFPFYILLWRLLGQIYSKE